MVTFSSQWYSVRTLSYECFKIKAGFQMSWTLSVVKWEGSWWSLFKALQRALTYCVLQCLYITSRCSVSGEWKCDSVSHSAHSLSGCGQWRNPGHDGERPDSQGPGGRARLCPAGEPHQRGGVHREPPQTLQGEPHLCKRCSTDSIHS